MYYYPGFQSSIHGDRLRHELARDLTRETAWEAVMRIRCGKGYLILLSVMKLIACKFFIMFILHLF